ncbi:3-phosphoinositide-dependent protein kinase 1-like protein [Umbelopsis sp. PMI_123]|nr:3-phosphoinositide-dependent protein kinase 1-like protein [Umbelopsis sp. PMI_123]
MVNTMAEDSSTSSVKPSTSIGDTSRPAAKAAESQHSQTNTPATTNSNSHNSTTASAAEVANPDHPHHRHHRTINDFELMGTLGEGSYSTVLAAKDKKTGHSYAIKVLDKFHIIREKKQKYVNIEKLALIRMNHPGVVNLYWTLQDRNSLYFIITLAPHGELLTYIKKLGSFDLPTTQFYAAQILSALEHVHSKKVIHRDVKPENILLDENMHIKLTDFGSAKLLDDEEPSKNQPKPDEDGEEGRRTRSRSNSFVGTAEYVSPELLSARAASTASDFWALGCIIYQLLAGKPPFKAATDWLIFEKIRKLDYSFPVSFPAVAKDLVQKLLVLDPQTRLGSDEVGGVEALKAHRFFEGILWEHLFTSEAPKLRPFLPKMDGMNEYDLTSENNVFFQRQGHSFDDLARDPFEDDYGSEARVSMASGNGSESVTPDENSVSKAKLTPRAHRPPRPHANTPRSNASSIRSGGINSLAEEKAAERQKKIAEQAISPWSKYLHKDELILRAGRVNKRRGLFSKKRYLILTDRPRLFYCADGAKSSSVPKGEIFWTPKMVPELKGKKQFWIHTPHKTSYFEDPEGKAEEWVNAINTLLVNTFGVTT